MGKLGQLTNAMVATLALGAFGGLACGKRDASHGGGAPGATHAPAHERPPRKDTSGPLWALAPENATIGLVVGDGGGTAALAAIADLRALLSTKPLGKKIVDAIDEEMKDLPFDRLDARAYAAVGLDPARGGAIFVSAEVPDPLLVVVPV